MNMHFLNTKTQQLLTFHRISFVFVYISKMSFKDTSPQTRIQLSLMHCMRRLF